jgi:methyl-accepting chemotaxis protein
MWYLNNQRIGTRLTVAFADGDLTKRIERDYQGVFDKDKDSVNAAAVNQVSSTAQSLSQAASELASSEEETSSQIDSMSASIQKTSELVQEIAAASVEPSESVTQIGGPIRQLSKVTLQYASASGELAATSEVLSVQASNSRTVLPFSTWACKPAARRSERKSSPNARAAPERLVSALSPSAVRLVRTSCSRPN